MSFTIDGGLLSAPDNLLGFDPAPPDVVLVQAMPPIVTTQFIRTTYVLSAPIPGAPASALNVDNLRVVFTVVPRLGVQTCGTAISLTTIGVQQSRGVTQRQAQFGNVVAGSCSMNISLLDLDAGVLQGTFEAPALAATLMIPDAGVTGIQFLNGVFESRLR